jgi:hypothetical protein
MALPVNTEYILPKVFSFPFSNIYYKVVGILSVTFAWHRIHWIS